MKKNILFAALATFGLAATAQITVNRADMAVKGEWYLLATDTVVSASSSNALKVSGTNKTWDIKGWAKRNTKDTTFYADGLLYPSAPAGCNLVSFERDPITLEEMPTYMIASTTSLRVIFEANDLFGSGGAIKFFQFPSTFGTKFKDSTENYFTTLASDFGINLPFVDSLRIVYKMRTNSEIDGWGKLTMDAGTFDVLRQKNIFDILITLKIRNTITKTYSDLPGGGGLGNQNLSNISYTWVGLNTGHPLMQASTDTNGVITDITFMLANSRGLTSSVKENKLNELSSKVYPVPASNEITIETESNQAGMAKLSVYDILGNEVLTSSNIELNKGLNQVPVQINELKAGVYFYTINGVGFTTSNKFVVK